MPRNAFPQTTGQPTVTVSVDPKIAESVNATERSSSRQKWTIPAVGAVITLLVVWTGPFQGWLIRLDSTPGPHAPYPASLWGGGGYNSGLPYALVFVTLLRWFGSFVSWLPVIASVALAFWGAARMVKADTASRIAAGLLFSLSPIMYERIWAGQFGYLVGYALLPWFFSSLLSAREQKGMRRMRPALIWAAMVGSSVHFLWIGAVLIFAMFVTRRISVRSATNAAGLVVTVSLLSAYLWQAGTSGESSTAVGSSDLTAFATLPDHHYGLYANVLALYGFWREGAILPKDEIGGWPVFLVAILFVVIIGVVTALRNKMARNDGIAVVLIGVAGFVLALGAQGPFGSLFEWAYGNVPGFALMREPQKFAGLLALSYAYFFAAGAAHLIAKARTITQRRLNSLAAVILPVLYVPTLFFGLLHEVKAVDFPPSWEAADQLMGNGNGKVLALPWHQYMSYPFTDNRVVGSPVDALLRRDVISGDNTELAGLADTSPPRSRYIQFLLQNGPTLQSFGAQLRPLGVEYIVVTKAVDFNQYKWLRYQSDLEVVQETPDLVLYRNKHAAPDGYRGPVMQVADWGEAVGEVEANPDAPLVLQARALAPGVIRQPASALSSAQEGADVVKRKTQSAFKIGNGSGGVSIPAIYDDSWRAPNGASAVELASGNAGFRSDTPAGVASLTRWASLKRTYVISILALLVVVIGQFSRRQIVSASRFSVRRWLTSQGASRSSTK